MFEEFRLFPEAASTVAGGVDKIYLFLVGTTVFAASVISATLVLFSVRYRRRKGVRPQQVEGSTTVEIVWSAIPLVVFLGFFGWSAWVYLEMNREPRDHMQFYATGKQWMWKIQHPTGQREINELHVPVGQPIKLTMISEDVIHDFFVPAFRVKKDVVPGMYTTIWFEATKVGRYHLFCAEYCGTKHSEMKGSVVVMDPADYEVWLSGQPAGQDPVEAGRVLFENLRCNTCHEGGEGQRGPSLEGLFGTEVALEGGGTALFDEDYVRASILEPSRYVTAGYARPSVMPTYKGQVTETQVQQLIAYVRSLADTEDAAAPAEEQR